MLHSAPATLNISLQDPNATNPALGIQTAFGYSDVHDGTPEGALARASQALAEAAQQYQQALLSRAVYVASSQVQEAQETATAYAHDVAFYEHVLADIYTLIAAKEDLEDEDATAQLDESSQNGYFSSGNALIDSIPAQRTADYLYVTGLLSEYFATYDAQAHVLAQINSEAAQEALYFAIIHLQQLQILQSGLPE